MYYRVKLDWLAEGADEAIHLEDTEETEVLRLMRSAAPGVRQAVLTLLQASAPAAVAMPEEQTPPPKRTRGAKSRKVA